MTLHSHISQSLSQMLSFAATRTTAKVHKKWHSLIIIRFLRRYQTRWAHYCSPASQQVVDVYEIKTKKVQIVPLEDDKWTLRRKKS